MDVEINLALKGSQRRGRAVIDDAGQLYLGHRGGLGGGRGGQVTIDKFVQQIRGFSPKPVTHLNGSDQQLFVLGPVNHANFIRDLAHYTRECHRLREEAKHPFGTISPDEGDNSDFDPANHQDARHHVMRAIAARRGQQAFRNTLLRIYGKRCAITGCNVIDVLEAAHLTPYYGDHTNHVQNGLLLRADLHTLLDCHLLAIDPQTRTIVLSEKARRDPQYRPLHGRPLRPPSPRDKAPSLEALKQHFRQSGLASPCPRRKGSIA